MKAALENDCTRIICDESDLIYSLDTYDTYQLAEMLSKSVPLLLKVALICNIDQVDDAEFWETVAVNRMVTVRVFKDKKSAEQWIDYNSIEKNK